MRKITMMLATAVFVLGSVSLASAQSQGASTLDGQMRNATPVTHPAACGGYGRHCPPGRTWRCNGYGRCWCGPC